MDGFAGSLGVRVTTARDGDSILEMEATDAHLNPVGSVHGGVLATLVDTAMGSAVRSITDDDETPATSQLSLVYLRPGKPGPLRATAQVRKRGEHILLCEAEVEQDGDSLVHAVATFAITSS